MEDVVTLALLSVIKDVLNRPFYRWIGDNSLDMSPDLSHRTRLFRLFNSRQDLTERSLAEPTVLHRWW